MPSIKSPLARENYLNNELHKSIDSIGYDISRNPSNPPSDRAILNFP
jgi:hypothetical protein